jgi:hypothetical protein
MALNLVARTFRFAGTMIDKVRINEIRSKNRNGKLMWVKRRRRGSRVRALGANLFFRLAGNPISVAESRLVISSGLGRLWWGIRTEYVPIGSLRRRSPLLRQGVDSGAATMLFR